MLFNYSMNENTDYETLYNEINNKWNVNVHYGKQGNNVRLFGDTPATRCEIWSTKKGYDIFVGLETPLYSVANALFMGEWNEAYKGAKSKNEIALHNLNAMEITKILESVQIVQETPKKVEKPKTKTRNTKAKNAKKENKTA